MMHVDASSEGKLDVGIFGLTLFSALSRGSLVRDPSPSVCLLVFLSLNIQHVGRK